MFFPSVRINIPDLEEEKLTKCTLFFNRTVTDNSGINGKEQRLPKNNSYGKAPLSLIPYITEQRCPRAPFPSPTLPPNRSKKP